MAVKRDPGAEHHPYIHRASRAEYTVDRHLSRACCSFFPILNIKRFFLKHLRETKHFPTLATRKNENKKQTYLSLFQEIFERFFGTHNPFVDFGFGDTMPFASRLKKQGPRKPDPVARDLACSLEELYNGCTKALKVTRKVGFSLDLVRSEWRHQKVRGHTERRQTYPATDRKGEGESYPTTEHAVGSGCRGKRTQRL